MASSSDVANGKLDRQKGIIEDLNAKVKEYKTSITRALSEQEIAKYNAKLQDTQKDLARLNALGKVFEQTSVKVQEQTGLIGQLSAKLKELKSSLQQATTEKEVERLNIELAETSKELTRISSLGKVFKTTNVEVQQQNGLIAKLNIQLKELKVSLQQATSEEEVARLNSELAQTSSELLRINSLGKTITAPAVKSFDKFRVSAGAANGSAIAFNRIIQDAPFGIIGVGNNIQQFTEQLSALKIQTGSTGAAIRTFFTSLITPANLVILAVSAITAAFTAYQLGAFDSAEETEDLTDKLQNYIQTLKGVEKATLEGTISTEQEIVKFKSLASVLTDTNSSYVQRKNAIDQIKSGYGEYLGSLTEEQILARGLGKAYDDVISALIAKSALEANQKEINATIKESAELQKKRNAEEKVFVGLQELTRKKRNQLERQQELIDQNIVRGTKTRDELRKEVERLEGVTEEYNQRIKDGTSSIEQNDATLKTLIGTYTDSLKSLLSYEKGQDDSSESGNKLNRVFDEQILLLERLGNLKDAATKKLNEGFITDPLVKQQKNLFNAIASLKQAAQIGFNPVLLFAYEEQLKQIDSQIGSIESKFKEIELDIDPTKLTGLETPTLGKGIVQKLEDEISSLQARIKVTTDPEALSRYQQQLKLAQDALSDLLDKRKLQVEDLTQAFVGLGSVIGRAFKNPQLGTFVSQFASFVGQIVAGAFAVAKANAVAGATQSSLFTGPAAAFTLPAFIAASVGVVASAFAALGNFGGGGGGSASAGQGSTFTNRREFGGPVSKGRAYIVGEKRPELFVPNTNGIIVPQVPSMDYSGASMAAGAMAVDVNIRGVSYGDDILFTVQQAQIRRGIR
jgi:DNA repair exonuclease SbcCD ATPase subunit